MGGALHFRKDKQSLRTINIGLFVTHDMTHAWGCTAGKQQEKAKEESRREGNKFGILLLIEFRVYVCMCAWLF